MASKTSMEMLALAQELKNRFVNYTVSDYDLFDFSVKFDKNGEIGYIALVVTDEPNQNYEQMFYNRTQINIFPNCMYVTTEFIPCSYEYGTFWRKHGEEQEVQTVIDF